MSNRELPNGPFTSAIAAGSGWTPAAQRHAVQSGEWDRLQHGVFAPSASPDPKRYQRARDANLRAAQGASAACDRAVLSHASAAIAWDLPVIGDGVNQPCLSVQSRTALRRLAKVHLHRATLDEIAQVNGYGTTPVARTVADLSREHGVPAGLAAADAALHSGLTTKQDLSSVVDRQRGWPGVKAARRVADFADERSESPLESISRLRMDERHLPPPRPQALICDEWGVLIARADFYWDEYGVMGEADGAMKWSDDPDARDAHDEHTYFLETLGLVVVRWGWAHLRAFNSVARRLRLGFARGARPGSRLRRWQVRRQ